MPKTSPFHFTPDHATCFMPLVRQLAQANHLQTAFEYEPDNAHFVTGRIEGEVAFALAAASNQHLADTIQACLSALLMRLGLSDTPLSATQARQRGWIIGLFDALSTSVDIDPLR